MVTGYNAYNHSNNTHSLNYFIDILKDPNPSGVFNDYYSMPYSMTFDSEDNLYVTDINRWKVAVYKKPLSFVPIPVTLSIVDGYDEKTRRHSPR